MSRKLVLLSGMQRAQFGSPVSMKVNGRGSIKVCNTPYSYQKGKRRGITGSFSSKESCIQILSLTGTSESRKESKWTGKNCSSEEIKRGYFSLLLSQASPWTACPHNLKYLPPSQQPTKPHAGKCQKVLSDCKDCLLLLDQTERNRRWSPSLLETIKKIFYIFTY